MSEQTFFTVLDGKPFEANSIESLCSQIQEHTKYEVQYDDCCIQVRDTEFNGKWDSIAVEIFDE